MERKLLSDEQRMLLKKPLPSEAIKPHPTKNYLSTIKAIYVVERFNDVFGIGGWEITNEKVEREGKWVVVKSTFSASEYGIYVRDIFGGNDNADMGDAYKGACTDALTKIGSYLGIGMDVYKGIQDKPKSDDKKDPKNATSYNHKTIGTKDKPLIGNAAFKQAMERLERGELIVKEKVLASYTLTPEQTSLINDVKVKSNGQHA